MKKSIYQAIGLMSGTSLDGVDLCYVQFDAEPPYIFKILKTKTIPYNQHWLEKLKTAFDSEPSNLQNLSTEYGEYLGILLKEFIDENSIAKIDFIASHGHTIFHKPAQGYTLQIGDGRAISKITGQQVICDFRTQDVALGGQGAPLVPIGDKLLFSNFDACLNLGGFANVSYKNGENRVAFDICPVNIVLNYYANLLGFNYDDKGMIASSGQTDKDLLNALNTLDYYSMSAPKSLGFEWVKACIFPLISEYNLETKDILRTYIEHSAKQISNSIKKGSTVLITGGGAFNDFLIQRIEALMGQEITLPERDLINYKEALVFAFLGMLRSQNKINILASVTGAKADHSSGVVFNI